jgi:ABC-type lipoprotein release transport system permease subunit
VKSCVIRWGVAVAGSAVGLWVAFLLDDLIAELLFGVEAGDVATQVLVTGAMLVVTWVACLVPAGRAPRVDPVEVLKVE